MIDVSLGAAVLAGVISFLSPCVLPLVPPYLCFISGLSLDEMAGRGEAAPRLQVSVLITAVAFVLGLSTVFVLLGATASSLGNALRSNLPLLSQIAGIFIIIMGLNFLGVFRLGWLARDTRYQHLARPPGLFGSYAVGVAFAFGWTPCIGPVLAAILSVAATQESVGRGMLLLCAYSIGLGVPFMLAALSIERFLKFFARFRRHFGIIERIMGVMLVVTGLMFLTGTMQSMSYWLLETFPALATIG